MVDRLSALVGAGIALVLAVAVPTAASSTHRTTTTGRPLLGHPGNPFPIPGTAFSITAKAGSIVHVTLTKSFLGTSEADDPRLHLTTEGGWAQVTLIQAEELSRDAAVASPASFLRVSRVTTPFLCPSGPCPNAFPHRATSTQQFRPGDYVLAVAGPAGATVTFTLDSIDGTERVPRVTGAYSTWYAERTITPDPAPPGDLAGSGGWSVPSPGRRTLSGMLLGFRDRGQGGGFYSTMCLGGQPRNRPHARTYAETIADGCKGLYGGGSGGAFSGGGSSGPLPVPVRVLPGSQPFAFLDEVGDMSTSDGPAGGSYAAACALAPCEYHAVSYTILVDS